ncbi:MAG: rhodanese-like domain-containing protein, partial [Dehalococcoidia bacterium]
GAINIPLKDIARGENLQKLNPDKKIVVYCYTGRTASQATAILNALGYDAWNLKWGISGWTADPEVAPYRFNLDTSADYPVQTGEVEIPESPESPTTPEAPPAEEEAPSGPCG